MKYDVEYFKQSAFRTLAGLFPTTLEDWDRRDSSQIQHFYGLPFAVVKLCRDTGLTTLLPAALCSACFTLDGVTDILNGRISSKHRHRAELYHADKIICLKARETLHNALRQLLLMTLLRRAVSCPSPERCNPARLESLHSLIESKMMRDSPQHIFHVKFQTLLRFHAGVCAACLSASEMSFEAARANLWSELPSFFSLPSWQELRKSLQTHGLEEPSTSSNRVWESPWKGTGERYDAVSEISLTHYLNRKAPAKSYIVDVTESRLGSYHGRITRLLSRHAHVFIPADLKVEIWGWTRVLRTNYSLLAPIRLRIASALVGIATPDIHERRAYRFGARRV
jgi:hypothetical protein